MCNCKGWDIAYWPNDVITVEQHFCRVLDDCGHVHNTLEEVALQIANEYNSRYDWYCDAINRELVESNQDHLDYLLSEADLWRKLYHPDYLYYKKTVYKNAT